MSDEQLMITTFTKAYNKYIYDEMVIGQLAHTELKNGAKTGAEVDVIMPAMVNLFDYTGGDLSDAEITNTTTATVKFDKGKAFHFEVDEVIKGEIETEPVAETKKTVQELVVSDDLKDELVKKAKELGISGNLAAMKAETLEKKIAEAESKGQD